MSTATSHATEHRRDGTIRSLIPARIDRLSWSTFHTRMIVALGVAWILDGLEITVASNVGPFLEQRDTLHLSARAVGDIASVYLIGEVIGALVFGRLSDRLGRRNLFMVTLGVYLVGSALTALTFGHGIGWVSYLYATRIIAGMGIGGEYAAINSAIDEMLPARYRGRVDIGVNGTYWAGAFIGTLATYFLLNNITPGDAWRVAFVVGPALALVILFVRRNLPESPRWLLMHGRVDEAEAATRRIEEAAGQIDAPVDEDAALEIAPTQDTGMFALARVLFRDYPARSVLGASLMITQSFLYNAIFFTLTLILSNVYGVPSTRVSLYFLAFCAGNLLGPLTIGRLFDSWGRKRMIAGTYLLSGAMLLVTAFFFKAGLLDALTQTIAYAVIFFFASAGASAAYLTVSEIFPVEVRAKAIAVFFAIAQCFGALGPSVYGSLIGSHAKLFVGFVIGAVVMMIGGAVEIFLGIAAEGRSLEDVARPLSLVRKAASAVTPKRTGVRTSGSA